MCFPKSMIGKKFSHRELRNRLKEFCALFGAVPVLKENKPPLKLGKRIVFSGMYPKAENDMRILLECHVPKNRPLLYFTKNRWKQMRFNLVQAMQHELIHVRQNEEGRMYDMEHVPFGPQRPKTLPVKRKVLNKMRYLSELREIEPYGHDIAMEILHHYPGKTPNDVFGDPKKYPRVITYTLYSHAFKLMQWDAVREELLRSVNLWFSRTGIPTHD